MSLNGGTQPPFSDALDFEIIANVPSETIAENIRLNLATGTLLLDEPLEAHEKTAIICGGGPSLKRTLEEIRGLEGTVFALNNSAKFLDENGIHSAYQVCMDARPENMEFDFSKSACQLIATQAYHGILSKCNKPVLWHADSPETLQFPYVISATCTVGLYAMCVAYAIGFRTMRLYGYDSSFDENTHAYPQTAEGDVVETRVADRSFKTNSAMAMQASRFPMVASALADLGCVISVHGDGLLPYVAWLMTVDSLQETMQ